ncbi:ornithine cyclodeaminase [Sphingomonas sp. SORGH_AS 950]|uniref:ornithine cyclodeaminase family protein n=1 Tax=Sphingomonas sp. SORGH_AS_0950 TaxID=3041792 RepID=UPI002782010A|nr:ornithine cyclodeaminase family protein [Sphingomonas sp. SORGH_AS_0950]MDQ1158886.1 ornithine cyclodeaminase [Sphingomonas sp. SORGH_AS_0950]
MQFVPEDQSAALITFEIAFAAAREALIAATDDGTTVFPAVLAHGSSPLNRFSIKSGSSADLAGLKVGSYWPGNTEIGLPRHNSLILLIDQHVGRVEWVIEAGRVNAYRTAAADAVAADALARTDASVLAIFGTGHQALYECRAITRIRHISEVLVIARDSAKGESFAASVAAHGMAARIVDGRTACEQADIIVTATGARAPLFDAAWVQPGTHIASMGSDAVGKQELPPALFDRAALFCDQPAQSVAIGDLQHFAGDRSRIVAIGDVLSGRCPGRRADDDITVFDSSGIALQDLYIARHLIAALDR